QRDQSSQADCCLRKHNGSNFGDWPDQQRLTLLDRAIANVPAREQTCETKHHEFPRPCPDRVRQTINLSCPPGRRVPRMAHTPLKSTSFSLVSFRIENCPNDPRADSRIIQNRCTPPSLWVAAQKPSAMSCHSSARTYLPAARTQTP